MIEHTKLIYIYLLLPMHHMTSKIEKTKFCENKFFVKINFLLNKLVTTKSLIDIDMRP